MSAASDPPAVAVPRVAILLGPLDDRAHVDASLLARSFPGYDVEPEPAYANYHLKRAGKLVASIHVDPGGRSDGVVVYAEGPRIGGTDVQVGDDFASVRAAFELSGCTLLHEASTSIECVSGGFVLRFPASAPGADRELELDEAAALVDVGRLAAVVWTRPEP